MGLRLSGVRRFKEWGPNFALGRGTGRRAGVVRVFGEPGRDPGGVARRSLLREDRKVPGGCKGYGFHDFAKGLKTLRK